MPAPGHQCRRSAVDPRVEWTRLDGAFRRFPLGVRKVGRIAATGEPIEEFDLLPDPPGWVDPAAPPETAARPEIADRVLTDAEVRRLEADDARVPDQGPGPVGSRGGIDRIQGGNKGKPTNVHNDHH